MLIQLHSSLLIALLAAALSSGCEKGSAPQHSNLIATQKGANPLQQPKELSFTDMLASAQSGDAASQFIIGSIYHSGQGVPKNPGEALNWYRLAATQGNIDAQLAMGRAFQSGEGTAPNPSEAINWLNKAAAQGNVEAQLAMARAFEQGSGVPKNTGEAINWYNKAAAQGNAEAKQEFDKLTAKH